MYWYDVKLVQWVEIDEKDVDLAVGSEETLLLRWNTSEMVHEAFCYVMVNVSPVPYEEDVEDNFKVYDTPVFIAKEAIHDIVITSVDWEELDRPIILGESAAISIHVYNNGTVTDTFNVTLHCSLQGDGFVELAVCPITLNPREETTLGYSLKIEDLEAGLYKAIVNAIVVGDINEANNRFEKEFRIIDIPVLNIIYSPNVKNVSMGDMVFFDAATSYHRDPNGTIVENTWRVVDPDGVTVKTCSGVDFSYTFNRTGIWKVVLEVKDNYNITWTLLRPATSPYRLVIRVYVEVEIIEGSADVGADDVDAALGPFSYNDFLNQYDSLQGDYDELLDKYNKMKSDYDNLLNKCISLKTDYDELKSKYDVLTRNLGNARILNYVFIITTIIFVVATIASTVCFATRKPKVKLAE